MKSDFRVFGRVFQDTRIHWYVMELIPCLVVCFSGIVTVTEISIRTKNFIVKNKLWRVISEKKKRFLMKNFMIILKANLIKISDNKKKNYVNKLSLLKT